MSITHTTTLIGESLQDLTDKVNILISDLMKISPFERDFTVVDDVKYINKSGSWIALITFKDGR